MSSLIKLDDEQNRELKLENTPVSKLNILHQRNLVIRTKDKTTTTKSDVISVPSKIHIFVSPQQLDGGRTTEHNEMIVREYLFHTIPCQELRFLSGWDLYY